MALDHKNTLSPLGPHHHNRSMSSITSEAATFHSAVASPTTEQDEPIDYPAVTCPPPQEHPAICPPHKELSAIHMSRTDSGYEAGVPNAHSQSQSKSHERRSTSSSSTCSTRRKRTSITSISSATTRPSIKRASRSTPTSSIHRVSPRPGLQARYSTPRRTFASEQGSDRDNHPTYTFFQFPSLAPTTPPGTSSLEAQSEFDPDVISASHVPPPPATIHYFLLPETRRLEYAAIDAASQGLRGFVTKLIPDCILPAEYRRRRFCSGDDASDAGSVRRYRLQFGDGEEKGASTSMSMAGGGMTAEETAPTRPGLWRRWLSFGRRGAATTSD